MKTYSEMGNVELLLDGYRGVYIPRDFVRECYDPVDAWTGADEEDLAILREGPDAEFYWEAWDAVYNSAVFCEDDDGTEFMLYSDGGDLFAANWSAMTEEEVYELTGETGYDDAEYRGDSETTEPPPLRPTDFI